MFASFVFVLPLSDLLLDFLSYQIDGRIQIAFDVFRKQVRAREREPNGTGKGAFRRPCLVVLESDTCIGGETVEMFEFRDSNDDVIFDSLGQCHVMRRKDQIHARSMAYESGKIQRKNDGIGQFIVGDDVRSP